MNKTEILTQIRSLIENREDLYYHKELLILFKAAGGNRFEILSLLFEIYSDRSDEEIQDYVLEIQGDLISPHTYGYIWDHYYYGPKNYRKGSSIHPDTFESISCEEYDKIFIERGWVKEDGEFLPPEEKR